LAHGRIINEHIKDKMSDPVASSTQSPPAPPAEEPRKKKRSAMDVLRSLREPKVAMMLALGFSSGLPFLLTANTFGYWLRDEGTSLKAIGFISWVGFAYAFKVYWSPLVDRWTSRCSAAGAAPRAGCCSARSWWRSGWSAWRRRVGPGLAVIGAFALLVAFASATQDIAIDAWRIEAASNSRRSASSPRRPSWVTASRCSSPMPPSSRRRNAWAGRSRTWRWPC
jgi:PAT family beta-lactamase induction signal transducer AmpG